MSISNPVGQPVPGKREVDAEVGRRIHMLMWDRGVTQTKFGLALGIDQSNIAKKLRGKAGWSLGEIVATARYFDVPIGYLFGEGEDLPAPNLRPKD